MADASVYALTSVRCVPGGAAAVARAVEAGIARPDAASFVACWTTEIGPLNEVTVLRRFDSLDAMAAHTPTRAAVESQGDTARQIVDVQEGLFAAFPDLPVAHAGRLGRFHEIRTYHLTDTPESLPGTIAAWQAAVPARVALSPLAVVMHALSGPPRIVHVWPFESLEQRQSVRAEAARRGVWPPQGTLAWIEKASTSIALPADFSPLQ